MPWALGPLLRDGPAPLVPRAAAAGPPRDVAVVLGPGRTALAQAGVPAELVAALARLGVVLRTVAEEDAHEGVAADVVLAAGWPAAPAVLRLEGVRARAVLATTDPAPLAGLGWTAGVPVLGPTWMGGTLPTAADAAYQPLPVHRRDDLVLVHGEDPFGLLAAAELAERRDDLTFAVSGAREGLVLPFPFLGVDPGSRALAHALASATVALAPPVRGWRPAAVAMLACGQPVVAPQTPAAARALGDAAALAAGPIEAAGAVEAFLGDLALRADRTRAGLARVGDWTATAAALVGALAGLADPGEPAEPAG